VISAAVSEESEQTAHSNAGEMSLASTEELSKPFNQRFWKPNVTSLKTKLKFRLMKIMGC